MIFFMKIITQFEQLVYIMRLRPLKFGFMVVRVKYFDFFFPMEESCGLHSRLWPYLIKTKPGNLYASPYYF